MPYIQYLDNVPIWFLLIVTTLVFSIAAELGFHAGKVIHERLKKEQSPMVSTILGASLGLLAFFLAFAFNMGVSRHDTRKQLVLDEAIAIETTYLRSKLIPKPHSVEFQDLLREYVGYRTQAQTDKMAIVKQAIVKSEELQAKLWTKLDTLTEKGNPSPFTAMFISSLNDVFNLHTRRVNAGLHSRIPISIFVTLYFVAFLAMAMMGYQAGLSGKRSPIASLMLILAFAIVLALIVDLERPRQELFGVSQQPMINLKNKLIQSP